MGELTRNFNWSGTSIGSPDEWPYSLRTTVSNILRSRFPMFLWWGEEMIQFYNDAYRPSMGINGKHPKALGQKGADCWKEIWDIISPLHKQVQITGEATWSEDQLVPIYRNGKLEDVYWTFSYSSVLNDDNEHGGILVTCMETTKEVLGQKMLKESEARLHFALEAGHLGAWELDLKIFDLKASNICKQIFGQPLNQPFSYETLRSCIHPDDRQRQEEAVLHTINTGADYDIEYRIILPDTSVRWVNIRGQLQYDQNNIPQCMAGVSLDITHRKEAENKLSESEARLRNIIEQAPLALALTQGEDFIFENINTPMLRIINKKNKQDVIGKSLMEVLPELVSQPVFDILLHVLHTGEVFRGTEVEAQLANNGVLQRRYFNVTYSRVYDKSGIPSILHMATDVTDQLLVRRKTEESEAKLRSILNSAPTAIGVFVGPDLIVENPNQLMIEVMAAGPDIEGKSFRKLLSGLVDQDQTFLKLVDTVRSTGQAFEGQEVEVFFRSENKTRYFNINFIPLFDESGTVYAVLDVSVDVTEQVVARKKIEESKVDLANALEQLRLARKAAELGTFDMDLKKGTMHWDDRCRILFGISHHQPVTYEKDFVEGLHPDDRKRIIAIIDKAFIKSESDGEYDVEYRTIGAEDHIERWVKAKGKVHFDETETPVRFIGSVLNITAQKTAMQKIEKMVEQRTKELARANESLQATNKELHRSNQNLEEFAHAASHDLKEPIRKIHYFTNQLKAQLSNHLNENEARSFDRIENATRRMGNLIDDLLLYSHVSVRPQETEAVDLNIKLQRVMEDLELDIEEKKAVIHVGKLPVIYGYRRQLQQLFQNILSNALKYSKADVPPIIDITAKEIERGGLRYHAISITDNGIGFDLQYADRIFQMFARLHGKSEYSGTGVGLSIVKKVVENHNGFTRVESTPGVGSTFEIYLPVK